MSRRPGTLAVMRIGITGTTGRLGAALARHAASCHEVVELPRRCLDLGQPESFEAALDPLDLDALVNPAAITAVDACEDGGEEAAQQVNAEAPAVLARWAADRSVRLVQISTDYVFSGRGEGLRGETDATDPVQVYGATKLAGERAVLEAAGDSLVVRVSWVFGPEKDCFLEGAIRRAMREEKAGAIADKWSLPLHTGEAAPALLGLLEHPGACGVVHLAQSGPPCSWREWAQEGIDALAETGHSFRTRELLAQRVAEVPFFTAERPVHTALATDRLERLLGRRLRDWREVVREYVLGREW